MGIETMREILEKTALKMGISQDDLDKMEETEIADMIRDINKKKVEKEKEQHRRKRGEHLMREDPKPEDQSTPCKECGAVPIVPETGLCGPCTFGEIDTGCLI